MIPSISIYLSIYEIYIAPLQGNYSEALQDGRLFQAEGPTIEKALCCLMAVRA